MTWKKGESGNPLGRTPEDWRLKRICRTYTEQAITLLANMLKSQNESVALGAAKELLDRAYGKPKQTVEGKLELEHIVRTGDASSLAERLGRRTPRAPVVDTLQ